MKLLSSDTLLQQKTIALGEKHISVKKENVSFCGVEKQDGILCGNILIPIHKSEHTRREEVPLLGQGHTFCHVAFYVYEKELVIFDYDDVITDILNRQEIAFGDSPAKELYGMICHLIEKDSIKLDNIYKQLAALEEEIPKENSRFFLQRMATMKQTIYQMYRYYNQMTEMIEEIQDINEEEGILDDVAIFEKVEKRTERLSQDSQVLREYAMEIWEIYQSQISIHQNDIMKVLTLVTTIFLPLSLIAAWYGMNFQYMPELAWKYGYLFVIVLALFVAIFSMTLFKRKNYW